MVCIFYYFYRKTSLIQLQAEIKKLFQAERESNIIVCIDAWIKKDLIFRAILFSATYLYWWTENKTKVLISNYSLLKRYSILLKCFVETDFLKHVVSPKICPVYNCSS